jgi:hypothetical protein
MKMEGLTYQQRYYLDHKEEKKKQAKEWIANNKVKRSAIVKRFYQSHKEEIKEQSENWYTEHPDRQKEIQRAVYQRHREERLEKRRQNYRLNPDKYNESTKQWNKRNPLYSFVTAAKRRAKKKGFSFDLTVEHLEEIWTGVCPILCEAIQVRAAKGSINKRNRASLDRIDNSKGYVIGNVQWLSWQANTMKSNGSLEDMIKIGEWAQKQLSSVPLSSTIEPLENKNVINNVEEI